MWKYVVTFPEEGHPRPTGIPSPGSAPLSHLSASINAVLSMHQTPRVEAFDASKARRGPRPIPISAQFLLFIHAPSMLKMYWVVLAVDCRNSVCRNRVCRSSVCLPYKKYETCPVNRKVKCITGSVFVFVSREATILAQNALETVWRLRPDPLGELTTALPQTP